MSVNELHSWFGLRFSCLLFTVFLTGTLTVFDNEITHWMQQPEYARISLDAPDPEEGTQNGGLAADRPSFILVKLQKNRSFSGLCFFALWCCCFAYSCVRGEPVIAWKGQLYAAGILFALLPVVNGLTMNRHLFVTVPKGDWMMAGFDLTALTVGSLLGWAARRIVKTGQKTTGRRTGPMMLPHPPSNEA